MSQFRASLERGDFTVTAEIGPPRGAGTGAITRKVAALRDWVTAVNITDNQGAAVRLSSWAGSLAAMAAGVEPIMQVTCRDRNRIALQSDLLGAAAMGIPNILVMTGDHPKVGDHASAKPVFDLDSIQLLGAARTMRDEGRLLSGRELRPPPSWFLGSVENPGASPEGSGAARLGKKVAAGAQFVQTQYVFDARPFGEWMSQVRDLGLHERCYILAGVGPISSLRALSHLEERVPGVQVPAELSRQAARSARGPARRRGDDRVRRDDQRAQADPRRRRGARHGRSQRAPHPGHTPARGRGADRYGRPESCGLTCGRWAGSAARSRST